MLFHWHIVRPQPAAMLRQAASQRPAVVVCPRTILAGCGQVERAGFTPGNRTGSATTTLLSKRYPGSGSERLDR
jgi:hypothetical protein